VVLPDGTSVFAETSSDATPAPTAQDDARQPEPSKVAAALDALLGRRRPDNTETERLSSDVSDKPPTPSPAAPTDAAESSPAAAPSGTTGSLLAAKRRARERLSGSPGTDE
jgi:hypothetical protein